MEGCIFHSDKSIQEIVIQSDLKVLFDGKKYSVLREVLSTMNPADIAALFTDLQDQKISLLFRLLPKELAAETFKMAGYPTKVNFITTMAN